MTERALVLGGGGAVGNAWMIGVIAGLFDAGLDVTNADLIIGTSAGATAAAQITGRATLPELLADILSAGPQPGRGGVAAERPRSPSPATNHMERTDAIFAAARDAADLRRRIGAAALEMDAGSDGSAQKRWREIVAARLPSQDWPQRRVLITAVDAESGEPVAFDRDSGVDLADAIAASTSNGFGVAPYRIGGKWYIDGGYPSAENSALAAGTKRVLVLSPFGGRSRAPQSWGVHLAAQVEDLRRQGSKVETIFPDTSSKDAFGINMMDVSARSPSAQAGFNQGKGLGAQLAEFWR
jgi:NTE family protein